MKKVYSSLLIISLSTSVFAQNKDTIVAKPGDLLNKSETGNKDDILSKLLQISTKGNFLSSSGNQYTLKFTPYAVWSILDSTIRTDTKYKNTTFVRNFSINTAFESSSKDNAITGLDPGFTYAIYNGRDSSVYNYRAVLALAKVDKDIIEGFNLILDYGLKIIKDSVHKANPSVDTNSQTFLKLYTLRYDKFRTSFNHFSKQTNLDPLITEALGKTPKLNSEYKIRKNLMDSINTAIANKGFLAISPSSHLDIKSGDIDSLNFKLQYLKGFSKFPLLQKNKAKKAWEMEWDINYYFQRDTLLKGFKEGDLTKRMVFNPSFGLNKVLFTDPSNTNTSLMELKVSIGDECIDKGLYKKEKTNTAEIETVLRIRVSSGLWLPLDFKYDPAPGSWFGFISLTYNFVPDSGSGTNTKSKN